MKKLQDIVLYTNPQHNLFYVGIFNTDISASSASLAKQYSRAKYAYQQMMDDKDARALKSGFMMALINTKYEGWSSKVLYTGVTNENAIELKQEIVSDFASENEGYSFVGSDRIFVKGEKKSINGYNSSWNRKWNINSMNKEKIKQKIDFILKSITEDVPKSIYLDAYMCITIPGEMAKRHNFKPFEINDLVSLYKYVKMRTL
jgi:disulfide oxidoreductase YuzD